MTPTRARLILFAVMAIFLATATNALFMQDRAHLLHGTGLPSTAISLAPLDKPSQPAPNAAAVPQAFPPGPRDQDSRLRQALQRELARRGYASQLQLGDNGLRLAVLAYEFDNALPLTGEPAEGLLKRVLFDLNQAPRGVFADRAEMNAKLVLETQKELLELGFFRGTLSARADIWTANAIKDFERHRGLPLTGRLTEATLLELITYSGRPILLSAG